MKTLFKLKLRLPGYLCLNHVEEVSAESLGQAEDVGVFALRVPQGLDLLVQLWVHRLAGLAQPLIQALSAALVGGDGPLLDRLQLVVPHQLLPGGRWCRQRDAA